MLLFVYCHSFSTIQGNSDDTDGPAPLDERSRNVEVYSNLEQGDQRSSDDDNSPTTETNNDSPTAAPLMDERPLSPPPLTSEEEEEDVSLREMGCEAEREEEKGGWHAIDNAGLMSKEVAGDRVTDSQILDDEMAVHSLTSDDEKGTLKHDDTQRRDQDAASPLVSEEIGSPSDSEQIVDGKESEGGEATKSDKMGALVEEEVLVEGGVLETNVPEKEKTEEEDSISPDIPADKLRDNKVSESVNFDSNVGDGPNADPELGPKEDGIETADRCDGVLGSNELDPGQESESCVREDCSEMDSDESVCGQGEVKEEMEELGEEGEKVCGELSNCGGEEGVKEGLKGEEEGDEEGDEEEDEQVMTFEEFKKKHREQGEGLVRQRSTDMENLVPAPSKKTTLTNYASVDCGAKVVETNPEALVRVHECVVFFFL